VSISICSQSDARCHQPFILACRVRIAPNYRLLSTSIPHASPVIRWLASKRGAHTSFADSRLRETLLDLCQGEELFLLNGRPRGTDKVTRDPARTLAVAEIALNQIKAFGLPADPESYALWYNYAAAWLAREVGLPAADTNVCSHGQSGRAADIIGGPSLARTGRLVPDEGPSSITILRSVVPPRFSLPRSLAGYIISMVGSDFGTDRRQRAARLPQPARCKQQERTLWLCFQFASTFPDTASLLRNHHAPQNTQHLRPFSHQQG
jgi:hypothetical protein